VTWIVVIFHLTASTVDQPKLQISRIVVAFNRVLIGSTNGLDD
jgi:hypothetical protein